MWTGWNMLVTSNTTVANSGVMAEKCWEIAHMRHISRRPKIQFKAGTS